LSRFACRARFCALAASLVAVVVLLAGPPTRAAAQDCVAQPDVAAMEQYCETVPAADGGAAGPGGGTNASGDPAGPTLRSVLPEKIIQRIERESPDAAALLDLSVSVLGIEPGDDLAAILDDLGLDERLIAPAQREPPPADAVNAITSGAALRGLSPTLALALGGFGVALVAAFLAARLRP
jgi:hypothetical protein